MKVLELIKESRFEKGRGSLAGRSVFTGGEYKEPIKSEKTKVPTFDSIAHALGQLGYGRIFTTIGSKRMYVVTKADWGRKSTGRVAKGFKEGTPFSEVRAYAVRTMKKHGGQNSEKFKNYKEHR